MTHFAESEYLQRSPWTCPRCSTSNHHALARCWRCNLLRHRRVWNPIAVLFLALALVLGGPSSVLAQAATPTPSAGVDGIESTVVALLNQYRVSRGLTALPLNEKLNQSSHWMATDMATLNYFSHTDSLGRWPSARATAYGYPFNSLSGENIAAGTCDAATVMDAWRASPVHDANMLSSSAVTVGIGRVAQAGTGACYWTMDLGLVLDPSATATPTSTYSAEELTMRRLVNDYRTANGRAALTMDDRLTAGARWLLADLDGRAAFSHLDSLGRLSNARNAAVGGYPACCTNEVLAMTPNPNTMTARAALDAWKASVTHNSAILAPDWVDIGVVQLCPGAYACYWAVELGDG